MAVNQLADRIQETTTVTGTGTATLLGAVTGFRPFSTFADGDTVPYLIVAVNGSGVPTGQWETGVGTVGGTGTTLARTTPAARSTGDALPVVFAAGTKNVFVDLLASMSMQMNSLTTQVLFNNAGVIGGDAKLIWDATNGGALGIGTDIQAKITAFRAYFSPTTASRFFVTNNTTEAAFATWLPRVNPVDGYDGASSELLFAVYNPNVAAAGGKVKAVYSIDIDGVLHDDGTSDYSAFYIYDEVTGRPVMWIEGVEANNPVVAKFALPSNYNFSFSSTFNAWGTPDLGLGRTSAGLLEVNTGTPGALAGLGVGTLSVGGDTILSREAAATLQMGADVNGAAIAQTFKAHDGITGTNIAGANLTLAGGRGTGTGAPGNLVFQTAVQVASGTTAQTLGTRLQIIENKIGFFGATPVVQGASVADASGGAIIDAEARTALNALISRIEATGLIATV